ncbi:HET-domain-containing protein [Corynespora cassiicola Philippines]|uniref:HET-domain-containing protein n=1 Tax=Corynespora cassiicola Philippines TaxID=1448308 RepID=A0A2T2NXH3_CORCC|nr:HET-domain-containing protein [Corynespora cassiicola Philippines]
MANVEFLSRNGKNQNLSHPSSSSTDTRLDPAYHHPSTSRDLASTLIETHQPSYPTTLSPDSFKYPALQDGIEGSVRLIRLDPCFHGDTHEHIRCTLVCAQPWLKKLHYECLSYCWGDAGGKTPIYIRTRDSSVSAYRPFLVTFNLYNALVRLRDTHSSAWLWIDAISINQDDTHEKDIQVGMMNKIYSNAAGVVIWLGECTDELSKAVSVIYAISEYFAQQVSLRASSILGEDGLHLTLNDLDILKRYTSVDVWAVTTEEAYNYLASLFTLPWFRRVWVLQEASSRTAISVRIGKYYVPWDSIILASLWQANLTRSYTLKQNVLGHGSTDGYLPELWLGILGDRKPRGLSMLELVCRARDFEATDPRDKVFALLGLANDLPTPSSRPLGLVPNYSKPKDRVYCDMAKDLMRLSGKLDVMCAVDTFSSPPHRNKTSPSWMPNLDVPVASVRGFGFPKKYNASYSTAADVSLLEQPGLHLRGFTLSTIGTTTETMFFRGNLRLVHSNGSDAIRTVWNQYVRPMCDFTTEDVVLHSYIHTLTAAGFALPTDFQSYPLGKVVSSTQVPSIKNDFAAYWAQMDPYFKDFHNPSNLMARARVGDAHQFAVLAGKSCHERKVFLTPDNWLGLGPRGAVRGDKVVILYGGSVPYVLRLQTQEEWRFQGEAYVDGFMDGAAKNTKLTQRIEEQIFKIC